MQLKLRSIKSMINIIDQQFQSIIEINFKFFSLD